MLTVHLQGLYLCTYYIYIILRLCTNRNDGGDGSLGIAAFRDLNRRGVPRESDKFQTAVRQTDKPVKTFETQNTDDDCRPREQTRRTGDNSSRHNNVTGANRPDDGRSSFTLQTRAARQCASTVTFISIRTNLLGTTDDTGRCGVSSVFVGLAPDDNSPHTRAVVFRANRCDNIAMIIKLPRPPVHDRVVPTVYPVRNVLECGGDAMSIGTGTNKTVFVLCFPFVVVHGEHVATMSGATGR